MPSCSPSERRSSSPPFVSLQPVRAPCLTCNRLLTSSRHQRACKSLVARMCRWLSKPRCSLSSSQLPLMVGLYAARVSSHWWAVVGLPTPPSSRVMEPNVDPCRAPTPLSSRVMEPKLLWCWQELAPACVATWHPVLAPSPPMTRPCRTTAALQSMNTARRRVPERLQQQPVKPLPIARRSSLFPERHWPSKSWPALGIHSPRRPLKV